MLGMRDVTGKKGGKMKKFLLLVVLAVIAVLVVVMFKAVIFGVILGALATIVYFSLTGSTLNWKKKK